MDDNPTDSTARRPTTLTISEASGMYRVSSAGTTQYYLDLGNIRVGERPGPTWPDHEWRWQRIVQSIELMPRHEAATIRTQFPRALQDGPA